MDLNEFILHLHVLVEKFKTYCSERGIPTVSEADEKEWMIVFNMFLDQEGVK